MGSRKLREVFKALVKSHDLDIFGRTTPAKFPSEKKLNLMHLL